MKKIYLFPILFLFSFIIFSCSKEFLEITPKGKLIIKTTADYELSLNNLSFWRSIVLVNRGASQVALGDDVAAIESYFTVSDFHTQRLFRYEDVVYEPDEDAAEMLEMKNIYSFNKVVNEVMNSTGGTLEQKRSIRAEGMANRAWCYFSLINYYGKPYSEESSSTDPGFPIVTEADVTNTKFERASVEEVYNFIINDLLEAIPDLPENALHPLRMSKAAARGLLGKIYVFMGKFNDALPYLDAAFAGLASSTFAVALYDYNATFGPGGEFLPIGLLGPTYPTVPNNREALYDRAFLNYWAFFSNELVLTPRAQALYGATDLRLNFFSPEAIFGAGAYPNNMLRRMGPAQTEIGINIPELYLLRAECRARTNNLSGAVADVETLRKNRMPNTDASVPPSIASNQNALVIFILEERIREFALKGHRWFDMRRLSVDPVYSSTVNYSHDLYDASGNVKETFTLKPERFQLRFPQKIIGQNPGMKNNP